jgi:hypothetical protein
MVTERKGGAKTKMENQGQRINRDITVEVDTVITRLYSDRVPDRFEVGERMRQRLLHECKSIVAGQERIKNEIAVYHRVKDEMEQIERREKRVNTIIGMFGMEETGRIFEEEKELTGAITAALGILPKRLRAKLSLWEAMCEYLQYVPEARIAEMEDFFQAVQMPNANRQAMESALKRHPETFKTRKDGRDKYISLKSRTEKGG